MRLRAYAPWFASCMMQNPMPAMARPRDTEAAITAGAVVVTSSNSR